MIFNKPKVFLSYRRSQSAILARSLYNRLMAHGAEVFLDVEDINGGRFANIIEKEIIERENFLVLLAPDTLTSEWVRKEIALALKYEKFIIPVTTDGFNFAQLQDYPEIAALAHESGIPYDFQYDSVAFARIVKALNLANHQRKRGLTVGIIGVALLSVLVLLFFSFMAQTNSANARATRSPTFTEVPTMTSNITSTHITESSDSQVTITEPASDLTATYQIQFQTAAAFVTASASP